MIDLGVLTSVFGWCAVINVVILLFTALWLTLLRDFTKGLHSALLHVDEEALDAYYFQWLGNYKMLVLVFNIVPYISLRLVA